MTALRLINVTKQHQDVQVLRELNLQILPGEFVAVIGPSGCGKSTLLRLIAGLEQVSSGKILINEQCINEIPASQRDIAMVFQSYALYPHMTVFDNMAYSLKMRGLKKPLIQQKIKEVSQLLQLEDYLQRKPGELSGGQRQRVAMGRAIVRSPALFLFDEPLSNLDAKLRTEMRYEIKKLHRQLQTTCLYVTHDQTEALTMADRIVILNKGKIEQVGIPQSLYHQPASLFVADFIGHYPSNFIPASINKKDKYLISDITHFPLEMDIFNLNEGQKVTIGIKPEDVRLTTSKANPDSIPAAIEFVEDMGSDKLIYLRSHCGKQQFTAKVSADKFISNEANVSVEFVLSRASIFDTDSGKRLGGWHG